MNTSTRATVAMSVVVLGLLGCQSTEPEPEATYDGRNLYLGYCASCHGATGAGDGPVAPALRYGMQDLRTLEKRKGVFPHDWLKEIIDGRTLRAVHGTREMPVWGWQFYLAEGSEELISERIDALVEHLLSIQADD